MHQFKNLINKRFGRLIVLEKTDKRDFTYIIWKCKCDCGNIFFGSSQRLLNGTLKSCGCLQKEVAKKSLLIGANKKYKEILNKTFSRWTVIGNPVRKKSGNYCLCKCKCGTVKQVKKASLLSGVSKSCGCLNREIIIKYKKNNHPQWKGGLAEHPLAIRLSKMKERCYNPLCKQYKYYGGKGIKIYAKWLDDPWQFIKWGLKSGWKEGLTIDRINPKGNYEPNNCQWLTCSENSKKRWKDSRNETE